MAGSGGPGPWSPEEAVRQIRAQRDLLAAECPGAKERWRYPAPGCDADLAKLGPET